MGGNIWLALDLHGNAHTGQGLASTLEYAIIYVASYAWRLLHQGSSVGFFTHAPQRIVVPPVQGAENVWNILRALAPLTSSAELPFALLLQELRSFMARGDALICFTPSVSPDWPIELTRPGLQTTAKSAVLFDPASFSSADTNSQNALAAVRALLAGLNVPVQTIRLHDPLTAQPALQGSGNWDFITTGTGKVVPRGRPEAALI